MTSYDELQELEAALDERRPSALNSNLPTSSSSTLSHSALSSKKKHKKRATNSSSNGGGLRQSSSSAFFHFELPTDRPPAAVQLANPLHTGYLWKLGTKYMCVDDWRRRYFVLKSGYLFKFESPTAGKPKGVPISLQDAQVRELDETQTGGREFCFEIDLIRKKYVIAADSQDALDLWLEVLENQKQVAIRQQLGHLPISQEDAWVNAVGDHLTARKLREEERVEAARVDSTAAMNMV